ncbi:MAG: nuclear transport factor 2 family protein [Flavisolibacter sp.]
MNVSIKILLIISVISCSPRRNPDQEKTSILDLLEREREAHFEKNAQLFMSVFSDSMISVNRGEVSQINKEQTRKRIEGYFNQVEFIKWDDTVPPKISFSNDASLAYALVQKKVIVRLQDDTKKVSFDTTDFAWVSIYRKSGNEWKLECNISTNK